MKISCVITDDEPLARKGLRSYVEKIDFLRLEGECEDALSLNSLLATQPVDLVFLDIEMPLLSGVDWLKSLPNPPRIIFTTAYEQYALQGYELNVLDYLLKPVSFDRFLKAANKALAFFEQAKQGETEPFFIKSGGQFIKLDWKEIIMVEAMENYMCFHCGNERHMVHITLKQLLEKMPPSFLQVHKSTLINTGHITGINGNIIWLGTLQAVISRSMREGVMERILKDKLWKK